MSIFMIFEKTLYVDLSNYLKKEVEISMTDLSGKVYLTRKIDSTHSEIVDLDISAFQNGLYMLSIKAANQRAVVEKISLMNTY